MEIRHSRFHRISEESLPVIRTFFAAVHGGDPCFEVLRHPLDDLGIVVRDISGFTGIFAEIEQLFAFLVSDEFIAVIGSGFGVCGHEADGARAFGHFAFQYGWLSP